MCWRKDGRLTESVVHAVTRDARGLAIEVENGVTLREYRILGVGKVVDGRLVAAWETRRFGLDGRKNTDYKSVSHASSIETAQAEQASRLQLGCRKTFAELCNAECAELQCAFNVPSTVFNALATGGPIDFTEWSEHGEEGHGSGISDQGEKQPSIPSTIFSN